MDENFKNIDEWMRKALEDHEVPFDDNAWDAMDALLDAPPQPPPQSVDDLVRHSLKGYEPAFENDAWVKMEAMLDDQPKSAPFLFFQNRVVKIAAALLLALLSAGLISHFLSSEKNSIVKEDTNTNVQQETISSEKYQVKTNTDVEQEGEALKLQQNNMTPLFPNLKKDKLDKTKASESKKAASTPIKLDEATLPNTGTNTKTQENTNNEGSGSNISEELAAISPKVKTVDPTIKTTFKESSTVITNNAAKTDKSTHNTYSKQSMAVESSVVDDNNAVWPNSVNNASDKTEDVRGALSTTINPSLKPTKSDHTVLESIPSKEATLIQKELALTVPNETRQETDLATNLPDLSNHFLRHSIGTASFGEMNFVDKVGDAAFGYSTGLAYEYRLNKKWGLQTGLYWGIKRFYSENVETPPYLLGQLTNSTVEYASVEIPLVAKFYVKQSKHWESFVSLGHSVFIPVKEKYYFTVAPPTANSLDSYENNFAPVTNTAYTSDSDNVRNRPPSYLGEFDSDVELSENALGDSSSDYFDQRNNNDASVLPLDARTRPMWGHINVGVGTKLKLNDVHALNFSAFGKMSAYKQKFDLQVSDYEISNYKRYFSFGLSLGWAYSFGHRVASVKEKIKKQRKGGWFFNLDGHSVGSK